MGVSLKSRNERGNTATGEKGKEAEGARRHRKKAQKKNELSGEVGQRQVNRSEERRIMKDTSGKCRE